MNNDPDSGRRNGLATQRVSARSGSPLWQIGFAAAQAGRKLSSMPASPRQMEVTSGMHIVWRIAANNAAVSPTALASLMLVT
jgi:hypothetical protein